MSNRRTFVKVRRSILEHIETRNLTPYEFAALMVIILSADKANGIWWGSDKALSGKFGYRYPERTAKATLASLREKGYLKMFRKPGERGNAPYLVNRYEITVGNLTGYLINADATTDWQHPATHHVPDDVRDDVLDDVPAHVPLSIPQYLDTPIPTKAQEQSNTLKYNVGQPKKFSAQEMKEITNEHPDTLSADSAEAHDASVCRTLNCTECARLMREPSTV